MRDTTNPLLDLELNVDVPLTPEQLFDGWTNPETLKKWFCPRPWKVIECTIDLRPGGLFANVMQSPEGQTMPENRGCYLLIERPTRLVWTGILSEDFRPNPIPQLGFGFVCDLRFEALAQGGSRFRALASTRMPKAKQSMKPWASTKGGESRFHNWSSCTGNSCELSRRSRGKQ